MDKDQIYTWLDDLFSKHGFRTVKDEQMEYIDYYYIDADEVKYLFICKVFEDETELLDRWKMYENKDIALYLQNKKFARKDIRWDMYYLLISKSEIKPEDIARIERNKYCCKKFVIPALSKDRLKEELNLKLPFTDDFYKLDDLPTVATEEEFFKQLREKSQLVPEVFTDEVLRNWDDQAELIIDHFKSLAGEKNE